MKSKFLWSWTSWSSPLGKLFAVHLLAERDGARRRRLGQGPVGHPTLGSQVQGHRCPHRRQTACTRRNSRGDPPRLGRSAAALPPGLHAEPPFLCGSQEVRARSPETRAFPRGPNTPEQDPLQSARRASLPPSLRRLPKQGRGALTGRR